jgi:hypothetical protein
MNIDNVARLFGVYHRGIAEMYVLTADDAATADLTGDALALRIADYREQMCNDDGCTDAEVRAAAMAYEATPFIEVLLAAAAAD